MRRGRHTASSSWGFNQPLPPDFLDEPLPTQSTAIREVLIQGYQTERNPLGIGEAISGTPNITTEPPPIHLKKNKAEHNRHDVERAENKNEEQPNSYDVERAEKKNEEKPNSYDIERAEKKNEEKPNSYDVERAETGGPKKNKVAGISRFNAFHDVDNIAREERSRRMRKKMEGSGWPMEGEGRTWI